MDFVGCCALTCSRCGCGFCAYCLKDCGADAHKHVAGCSLNIKANRDVFAGEDDFKRAQRERRRGLLWEFLTEQGLDEAAEQPLRRELLEACRKAREGRWVIHAARLITC